MDIGLMFTKSMLELMGIEGFDPVTMKSSKWSKWVTHFGPFTCGYCAGNHGKVFEFEKEWESKEPFKMRFPPVHEKCRCTIEALIAIVAGTATIDGYEGADYYIKAYKRLPYNYITKQEAQERGWVNWKGNLRNVAYNATLGGNIFKNQDGKLPGASGRIQYEADINYTGGYRNTHRIVYSNDGLVFVTYDHYTTFYEIILGGE